MLKRFRRSLESGTEPLTTWILRFRFVAELGVTHVAGVIFCIFYVQCMTRNGSSKDSHSYKTTAPDFCQFNWHLNNGDRGEQLFNNRGH